MNNVEHPDHYGGNTPYEAIKVIEAWELNFNLGNAVKYISRAGKKNQSKYTEDLSKAIWYLQREISNVEKLNTLNTPLCKAMRKAADSIVLEGL
jgi:hypothetical protein